MATQYKVSEIRGEEFIVQHYKKPKAQKHNVSWVCDVITCSCKNFEFWGIICRHTLSIFLHKDCFMILITYFPLRWQCDESHELRKIIPMVGGVTSAGETAGRVTNGDEVLSNHNDSTRTTLSVGNPPKSKTKGRPKQKRELGGKERAKKSKGCSFCKRAGHNITTCPDKENCDVNYVPSSSNKRRMDSQDQDHLNPILSLKC